MEFERRVAGRDIKPTGRLTVTTVEAIGQRFMPAILAQFQVQNPGVVIDLILSERELNLSRRDADVAIRVTNDPPETLVGRRICTVRWGVYCRRDLADRIGPDAIDTLPFIGFADDFGPPSARRWIEANVRPERLGARVNSVHSLLEMAVHGFGVCPLPCFLGEPNPGLTRLGRILRGLGPGLVDPHPFRSPPLGAGPRVHGFRRGGDWRSIAARSKARRANSVGERPSACHAAPPVAKARRSLRRASSARKLQ